MNSIVKSMVRLSTAGWRHFDLACMDKRSLAAATALRVLGLGLAIALLFAWLGMRIMHKQEEARIVEHVSSLISTVELTVRVACFTGDATLAREVSNGLLSNRSVASVRITAGREMLADVGKFAAQDFPKAGQVIRRAVYSPFNPDDRVGEVSVLVDEDYTQEQASAYAWLVALVTMLEMLLAAAAVAWVVMHTVVRPIRAFSSSLREVHGGTAQPQANSSNELRHLMDVFGHLLREQKSMLELEQGLRSELTLKEKRFRDLAEKSPNLIVRYDREFRRTYCNPAYGAKLGMEARQAVGMRPVDMWRISNMSAEEYQSLLQAVMRHVREEHVLLEWFGADGQYVVNDFHLVPETDEAGKVSGVLAIGHDISALQLQQRSDHDRSRVFEQIVQGGELPLVLDHVVAHVERVVRGYRCALFFADGMCGRLRLASAPWMPPLYRAALADFSVPGTGEDTERFWQVFGDLAARFGMIYSRSECILDQKREKVGVLVLYQERAERVVTVNGDFLRQACSLAAIAIERKRSEELIHHQASYDALTDLPNRRMFLDRLQGEIARAERTGSQVALLFIDLDRFKGVNDTLGHEVGDRLLVSAAARIRRCVREADLVARLGGDEFVVLAADVHDLAGLGRLSDEIVAALEEPFQIDLHVAYVSASIGIASYPADASSPDRLVRCADQAIYAAKDAGRNGFRFYSAELSESANRRLETEVDLRHALRHGEFELYYQPKMVLHDGRVHGAEALLRWNHPARGMVPPDRFIPVAEDCGLIMELGTWVLREACRTAVRWNASRDLACQVAINLSARQFQSGHLFEEVMTILHETECRPQWIELEITESLLLEESGDVLHTLQRFREQGISIAIDDFGTGYSALSYLARFPINTLKIDRSFTMHVTDGGYHSEVVKAILSIAQSLGQQVVAEGVETELQADFLRGLGCGIAQGYLYSKPVARAAFEARYVTELGLVDEGDVL